MYRELLPVLISAWKELRLPQGKENAVQPTEQHALGNPSQPGLGLLVFARASFVRDCYNLALVDLTMSERGFKLGWYSKEAHCSARSYQQFQCFC